MWPWVNLLAFLGFPYVLNKDTVTDNPKGTLQFKKIFVSFLTKLEMLKEHGILESAKSELNP